MFSEPLLQKIWRLERLRLYTTRVKTLQSSKHPLSRTCRRWVRASLRWCGARSAKESWSKSGRRQEKAREMWRRSRESLGGKERLLDSHGFQSISLWFELVKTGTVFHYSLEFLKLLLLYLSDSYIYIILSRGPTISKELMRSTNT